MPSIRLGDRTVDYSVLRGTSRRYTYVRFRPDLTLEVIIPRGKTTDVGRLLKARSSWIRREFDHLYASKHVLTRDSMMVNGLPHRISFTPGAQDRMNIDSAAKLVTVTGSDRRSVVELARRFFLKESSAYAVRRVAELAPSMGVKPRRVDVREVGKWGYCTRDRRISFSWQLAALPDRLKDYVILHELAHLKHFDHSRAFRQALKSVCPDYRTREKDLDLVVPYDRLRPPS